MSCFYVATCPCIRTQLIFSVLWAFASSGGFKIKPKSFPKCNSVFRMAPAAKDSAKVFGPLSLPLACRFRALFLLFWITKVPRCRRTRHIDILQGAQNGPNARHTFDRLEWHLKSVKNLSSSGPFCVPWSSSIGNFVVLRGTLDAHSASSHPKQCQ